MHFGLECYDVVILSEKPGVPPSLSAYTSVISGLILGAAAAALPFEIAVSDWVPQRDQVARTADDADERGYGGNG